MSSANHLPPTIEANLAARLAPFNAPPPAAPEGLDVGNAPAVTPRRESAGLIGDLKLLFAALGAGGSVVPLGDNGRTTRLLSNYAASLRDR